MRAMVLRRQGEPLRPEERDLPPELILKMCWKKLLVKISPTFSTNGILVKVIQFIILIGFNKMILYHSRQFKLHHH